MKKISLIFLIMVMVVILLSNIVLAYIDPSTGGILFNTLWPLILTFFAAVGAFFVKWFWKPLKKGFLNILRKRS